MNANEVIANRALELLGHKKGEYQFCSPNDHVNCAQSTNDAYPTAFRYTFVRMNKHLVASLQALNRDLFCDLCRILVYCVSLALGLAIIFIGLIFGGDGQLRFSERDFLQCAGIVRLLITIVLFIKDVQYFVFSEFVRRVDRDCIRCRCTFLYPAIICDFSRTVRDRLIGYDSRNIFRLIFCSGYCTCVFYFDAVFRLCAL